MSAPTVPHYSFDGGDLDCGSGLLLLIRQHIDPLQPGQLLEVRSTEVSVDEDLPAWCRMTGNELVAFTRDGRQRAFLIRKADAAPVLSRSAVNPVSAAPPVKPVAPIPPLSVMGIGSWPRPRWMLAAIRERQEERLPEAEFKSTARDAVRLAVADQLAAGVDVLTDGEQRRDAYASFVAGRLRNCQLVPMTDLLPLVKDPQGFRELLQALDVSLTAVRHPVLTGKIARDAPLVLHELQYLREITDYPTKVALPGPYLLSRLLWMECRAENSYASRDELAADIVAALRLEIHQLLETGASLVQIDEPVLTEVVFGGSKTAESFMCGALSARADAAAELTFATALLNAVTAGLPRERLGLHICRGNWTPDEGTALSGNYEPLLPLLNQVRFGTLFLELCTPRAGELTVLGAIPADKRIGIGVVNPKSPEVEEPGAIARRIERAVAIFGSQRLLLTPDCGFATFAGNPVAAPAVARAKLAAIVAAKKLAAGQA